MENNNFHITTGKKKVMITLFLKHQTGVPFHH